MNDTPICKCHNEPMKWVRNQSCKRGGRWRCPIKQRQYSLNHKNRNRESVREKERKRYWDDVEKSREGDRIQKAKARELNPEKFNERQRRWRRENALQAMVSNRRSKRRASLRKNEAKLLTLKHNREVHT